MPATKTPPSSPVEGGTNGLGDTTGGIHSNQPTLLHALSAEGILTEMRRQTYLMCAKTLTTLEAGVSAGEVDTIDEAEVLEFVRQVIMTLRDPIKPGR